MTKQLIDILARIMVKPYEPSYDSRANNDRAYKAAELLLTNKQLIVSNDVIREFTDLAEWFFDEKSIDEILFDCSYIVFDLDGFLDTQEVQDILKDKYEHVSGDLLQYKRYVNSNTELISELNTLIKNK